MSLEKGVTGRPVEVAVPLILKPEPEQLVGAPASWSYPQPQNNNAKDGSHYRQVLHVMDMHIYNN